MKFKLWTNAKTCATFIFVAPAIAKKHAKTLEKLSAGKALTENQADALAEDVPKRAWSKELKPVFIPKTIPTDDNINMMLKRLSVYLREHLNGAGPDDLYTWIEKSVEKNANLVANFVSNCFQNQKQMAFADFKKAAENYFNGVKITENDFNLIDKSIAFRVLMSVDIRSVVEPMQFKYTYNDYFQYIEYNALSASTDVDASSFAKYSHYSTTIRSFGEFDCVNVIRHADFMNMPWLFPYRSAKAPAKIDELEEYVNQLDEIDKALDIPIDNTKHKTHISFLQFKYNEINFNRNVDLGKAFDKIGTSLEIPFIKYRTYTNVYYKVDKEFMRDLEEYREEWSKWTELTGLGRKYPENTSIVFKIKFLKDSFCSFRLFDNFVYDVKFSIGKAKKTMLSKVYEFCQSTLNDLLRELRAVYPDAYVPDIDVKAIQITQITSVDFVSLEKKTIRADRFKDVIENVMFPYFNIIPTKERKVLHLQYKKVDHYLKYDNITAFVLMRTNQPKDDVIKQMSRWFGITIEQAAKEYENVENKIEMELGIEGDRKVFRPKTDGFVNVRIKMVNLVDMEFDVSGYKYIETHDRIAELMRVLVNLTNVDVRLDVDVKKLEREMNDSKEDAGLKMKDVDKDDIADADIDPDYLEGEEKTEFADAIGEVALDIDKSFLDIVAEYKDEPDVEGAPYEEAPSEAAPSVGEDKKNQSYMFTKLKEADKDMFSYSTDHLAKPRQEFSTLCSGRYPAVLNRQQKENIDKNFPGSYNGYLKVGSTREHAQRNYYICPEIWCPKSMVSMTREQFEERGGKCPFDGEDPMFLKSSYWGTDAKVNRYIGVLDPYIHPSKICIPCCFKKDMTRGKSKMQFDVCKKRTPELIYFNSEDGAPEISDEVIDVFDEPEAFVGNPKYIKGELNWPLQTGHYGLLPRELSRVLGEKKCGDRHDGTGNMTLDAECFLRRGSSNKEQSFLACAIEVLDNPEISSVADFASAMRENLTVERVLSLENGKIMKVFVRERFSIFDKACFREFVEWFLNQKKYVLKMNLGKVYRTLESLAEDKGFSNALRHHKDIVREFMIYNGYKHFLEYLDSDSTKDHRPLIDLVNSEREFLNPKNVNVVVIEIGEGRVSVQCPFNRSADAIYDRRTPFAFLLWNGRYYETLAKVRYTKEYGVDARTAFYYKHAPEEMKALIDFVCNNCIDASTLPERAIADIEVATGLKTKYLVLDYAFKAKGLLLSGNLYVPFEKKMAIFALLRKRFVYYSDVVNYKCTVADPKKAYAALGKKNAFYAGAKLSADGRYATLAGGQIVPLSLKRGDVQYSVFENDLEIFVGHEREDPRKNILSVVNENRKIFSVFLNSVITYINSNKDIRREIDFLTDFKNPFPMNFKRAKLMKILDRVVRAAIVVPADADAREVVDASKDVSMPCPDASWDRCLSGIPADKAKEFSTKISEQLLINNSFYFDSRTKVFSHATTEFLFEHHDLIVGKHIEWIKQLRDPFKILTEKLDEEFGEYVFKISSEDRDVVQRFVEDPPLKSNVDRLKTTLRNSFVVDVEKSYTNMYLYQWFSALTKTLHGENVDATFLKNLVRTHVLNDYEGEEIEGVIENSSFKQLWKEHKKKHKQDAAMLSKPPIHVLESFFMGAQYYPSLYELAVLSEFARVNLIVITRRSIRNPNGIHFFDNRSSHYTILHHKYDNKKCRDIYEVTVVDADRRKAIFNRKEIDALIQLVKLSKVVIEIDVPKETLDEADS